MEFNDPRTIGTLFSGLPKLKLKEDIVKKWDGLYTPLYPVKDRVSFLGVEVEVENVLDYNDQASPFWIVTDDGSLRNHGKEFITVPTRAHRIEHALHLLFTKHLSKEIDFSDRTSIHVHLNVRTFTPKHLMSLLMTYLVFEKALFTWVGHKRDHNIFCNPLTETDDLQDLYARINQLARGINWNKYSALNLAPINDKGTIEFRHLYGTKDLATIMFWINLILSLKLFALNTNPNTVFEQIKTLKTARDFANFTNQVFTKQAEVLLAQPNFNENCYKGVLRIKETIFATGYTKNFKDGNWDIKSPFGLYYTKARQTIKRPRLKTPGDDAVELLLNRNRPTRAEDDFDAPEIQPLPIEAQDTITTRQPLRGIRNGTIQPEPRATGVTVQVQGNGEWRNLNWTEEQLDQMARAAAITFTGQP